MRILLISFCALSAFGFSCDEALPPREEPQKFLQTSLSAAEGVVEIRDSVAVGGAGMVLATVKNLYVEVLQDQEFARADIDIWLRDNPQQRGEIIATRRDLTDQSLVLGGQLTLRPNVTASFLKQWSHRTVAGIPFWTFFRLTPKITPRGDPYLESDSVRFVMSGRVQLFKTKGAERLPQFHFTVVYRIF